MTYTLGLKSQSNLIGVHPDLIKIVDYAITVTTQDFSVHEGLRTKAQQTLNVEKGVSRTMASRHLTGHAVDLVPWFGGQLRWEWSLIYPIAAAMRAGSVALGTPIRWGGVWDRIMSELPATPEGLTLAVREYARRHAGHDFLDGPHFELTIHS